MKKIHFSVLLILAFLQANAQQNFEIGTNVGIPIGDLKDLSVNTSINISYITSVGTNIQLGGASGYTHFFRKGIGSDIGFIPVAAKTKYTFGNTPIYADLDLGYAISTSESFKGGLYFFPKVGYKFNANMLYLGYQNINSKFNFDFYDPNTGMTTRDTSTVKIGSLCLGYAYIFK